MRLNYSICIIIEFIIRFIALILFYLINLDQKSRNKNKDNNNNPCFINYLLRSQTVRKDIVFRGAGAQHYNIGQEDLKKVSINIPSLAEQNKISSILQLLDKKIELQTKKINDLKLFKKGLLYSIFNKKKTNTNIQTEINNQLNEMQSSYNLLTIYERNYEIMTSKFT